MGETTCQIHMVLCSWAGRSSARVRERSPGVNVVPIRVLFVAFVVAPLFQIPFASPATPTTSLEKILYEVHLSRLSLCLAQRP